MGYIAERRYQVFVSSTFEDLQEERKEVMESLLELDCIPSGMELFPASDDDAWTLIKRVIDNSDYYLVIVAGKYGSIGPDGKSYTQMEYEYALETSIPIIGFLHKTPGTLPADQTEPKPGTRKKLEEFQNLVKKKTVKFWTSPTDLGSAVSKSLIRLIRDKPAVGWVRGDMVPDESAAKEILRLRQELESKEREVERITTSPPPGTESLAQGDDELDIKYSYTLTYVRPQAGSRDEDILLSLTSPPDPPDRRLKKTYHTTWNSVLAWIAPMLVDEQPDTNLYVKIEDLVRTSTLRANQQVAEENYLVRNYTLDHHDFDTVKVQLQGLGIIEIGDKKRPIKDTATYWRLTPFGRTLMMRLRSIKR